MRARRSRIREPLLIDSAEPSPSSAPTPPCVVHVVRAANGPAPFRAFVEAMRKCPPGDHELVLAFKGFPSREHAEPYLKDACGLNAEVLFFDDTGFDLGVYFAAAARLKRERYCFLNSFSEPLLEGWLTRLDTALEHSDVGMVGASGSWNSSRSWLLYSLRLPSPYTRLLPSRGSMREEFARLDSERAAAAGPAHVSDGSAGADDRPSKAASADAGLRLPRAAINALSELPGQIRNFEAFPAHHLRTNAFMIAHSTLAALRLHKVCEKADAYVFESGRDSLTRQVQRTGLRAVVVDRDGEAYDQDRWHHSRTFWQGSQEGLLVADNQTRYYERGGVDRRRLLSTLAWGSCADPRPGPRPE
jgi:hypothetical protein